MSVADVSAALLSRSARPGHESSVIIEGATLTTMTFDSPVHGRFKLDVGLDIEPFRKCDTRAKVISCSRSCSRIGPLPATKRTRIERHQ